jgi:hypothetical protein
VSAIVETDGNEPQLAIGTMVRVGDAWRLIDLPANLIEEDTGGLFLPGLARHAARPASGRDTRQRSRAEAHFGP